MISAALFVVAAASATALPPATVKLTPVVDLDARGAFEHVLNWRPDHVATIRSIWSNARYGCSQDVFAKSLKAKHRAEEGQCGGLVMTSLPAKRRISFKLDGIRYSMTVPQLGPSAT